MNVAMKLTFNGLIRALRFKQLVVREDIATARPVVQRETEKSSGDHNEEWRERIAESPLSSIEERQRTR